MSGSKKYWARASQYRHLKYLVNPLSSSLPNDTGLILVCTSLTVLSWVRVVTDIKLPSEEIRSSTGSIDFSHLENSTSYTKFKTWVMLASTAKLCNVRQLIFNAISGFLSLSEYKLATLNHFKSRKHCGPTCTHNICMSTQSSRYNVKITVPSKTSRILLMTPEMTPQENESPRSRSIWLRRHLGHKKL